MKRKSTWVVIISLLFLLAIIVKSAWICDDAFISFRYIKNLLNGYGLRWNIFERVQAFTNPLYIFCTIPIFALTKNMYLSSMILSIGLTMTAVVIGLFSKKNRNVPLICLFILMLSCSKAFIDYSTSGLENPMTFLILVIFYKEFFRLDKPYEDKQFLKLCFIASLTTINRIDSILFVMPPLVYMFLKRFNIKKIYLGIIGFIPFIVWELFSLIYYGFLIPNTAVAKLNNTTNLWDVIKSGIRYIVTSNLYGDYITIIVILVAIISGVFLYKKKQNKYSLASLGILMYVLYVIYIGGDFMVGRFLSVPFFLSIVLIYYIVNDFLVEMKPTHQKLRKYVAAIAIIILIVGCMPQTSTIMSKIKYQETETYIKLNYKERPCDERAYYYNDAGLAYYIANTYVTGYKPDRPIFKWGLQGKNCFDPGKVYVEGSIGFRGYFCPNETIIIDFYGLAEPLLSRIPAAPDQRVGHYIRLIPWGYKKTLETGENVISNPSLRKYYDKLHLIVSGKLFSWERIKAIFLMNTGKYDYLIDDYMESVEYEQYLDKIYKENN